MECDIGVNNKLQSWLLRLMHQYSAMNFRKFQEMGVHPGQFPVLRTIYMQEGISQRELARRLHIKPPTVTVTIQRLEKSGMVYRKNDPGDLRISRMYLSEKGKSIAGEVESLLDENERILTRGFTEEELEQLRNQFGRMIQNLKEVTDCCGREQ